MSPARQQQKLSSLIRSVGYSFRVASKFGLHGIKGDLVVESLATALQILTESVLVKPEFVEEGGLGLLATLASKQIP